MLLRGMIGPRRGGLMVVPLYATMAIALLSPMATRHVLPSSPDLLIHLPGIIQARMALEEGQFPLRVAPSEHNGWRYPQYQFYGQLPFTIAALVYRWITPSNPFLAYQIVIWLTLTVAAVFTYRLAFRMTGSRPAAVVAGAMYMCAPYFLINIHARGAFTEAVAQGILPVALHSSLRCYAAPRPRRLLASGLAWAALATSHVITFVYGSLFVGLFFLFLGWSPGRSLARLARLGAGFLLGCALASYFLAPVVFADYVTMRSWLQNPHVYNWLTPLPTLLAPVSLPPEPQPAHRYPPHLHPAVGWPALFAAGVVVYSLIARSAAAPAIRLRRMAAVLLPLFGLALFMTWSPFDFWSALPRSLYVTQFTYRLLTQVMWTGSLLGAYALVLLFGGRVDGRHAAVALLLVGMASGSYLPPLRRASVGLRELVERPGIGSAERGTSSRDYLVEPYLYSYGTLFGHAELPLTYPDGYLMLEQERSLPCWLPDESPLLRLEGMVPAGWFERPLGLSVLVNGVEAGRTQLGAGPFQWQLPLPGMATPATTCRLKFVADGVAMERAVSPGARENRPLAVAVRTLTIEGLDPRRTVIPVSETQESFRQSGARTLGEVRFPEGTGPVQLPVLFYPDLLRVRVDGQEVPYFAVPHGSFVLVGVRAPPGLRRVSVSFTGSCWANWLSGVAWVGVVLGLVAPGVGSRLGRLLRRSRAGLP